MLFIDQQALGCLLVNKWFLGANIVCADLIIPVIWGFSRGKVSGESDRLLIKQTVFREVSGLFSTTLDVIKTNMANNGKHCDKKSSFCPFFTPRLKQKCKTILINKGKHRKKDFPCKKNYARLSPTKKCSILSQTKSISVRRRKVNYSRFPP